MEVSEISQRSMNIRDVYHQFEESLHGSKWSIEEDALAYLTDAGLVGRLTMDQEQRWPAGNQARHELGQKLAENIWWLHVLADRMEFDLEAELIEFLKEKEKMVP
ncbi:MazG-like protein [Levilactobacillus brevis]|uniref:MazG-like protein n=1 Tax=Levilactobacillus brevis TaxID=1580 RepID=UPI00111D91D6|nr:MazG-like protein [Levilactobacillus brevis]TOY74742.1 MazG-like protein [Levilactobacillus brevis]